MSQRPVVKHGEPHPQPETAARRSEPASDRFTRGLVRAFGGALVFGFPLLMTMEMWWLGFSIDRARLSLFVLLMIPILTGLAHFAGFESNFHWKDSLLDAFVAYAVGFTNAAGMLIVFGVVTPRMSIDNLIGVVALLAIPGSLGAVLARSLLGDEQPREEERRRRAGYAGEIFLSAAGALFLSFSAAPTEEIVLIAYKMTAWHALGLIAISLAVIHAFDYAIDFRGHLPVPAGLPFWGGLLRFTVVGYSVALLVSAYILWTFGRTDALALETMVMAVLVLGFPAALGAAAARLLL